MLKKLYGKATGNADIQSFLRYEYKWQFHLVQPNRMKQNSHGE